MRFTDRPQRVMKPTIDSLDRRDLPSATPTGEAINALRLPGIVTALDNDNRSEATNLGTINGTRTTNGSVGGSDPRDYYRFEASRGKFEVKLTNLSDDIDFELLRSDGSRIGSPASNSGPRSESKTYNLAGGTYFVNVYPGVRGARSDYKLSVRQVSGGSGGDSGGGSTSNPTPSQVFNAVKPVLNAALPAIQQFAEKELVNTPPQDVGDGTVKIESATVRLNNLRLSGNQVLLDATINGQVRAKGSRDIFVPLPFGGKRKVGSVSAEARAKFSGGGTIGISFSGGHLSARVVRSQRATVSNIRVDRIGGLGGAAARALGDFLVQAIDTFAPQVRIKVEQNVRETIVTQLNNQLAKVRI